MGAGACGGYAQSLRGGLLIMYDDDDTADARYDDERLLMHGGKTWHRMTNGCDTTSVYVCVVCGRWTEPSCSSLGVRASRGVIWPKALVRASPSDFQDLASAPASSSHPLRSLCKEALRLRPATSKGVETIGYRHSTRHDESLNRLCGQPSFVTVAAAEGMLVPVVARKPAITIAVDRILDTN